MDSQINSTIQLLDKYISATVRKNIEQTYYAKINQQAKLNEAIKDPNFLFHPLKHVSLTTDHGVIHIRDIAHRTVSLLTQLNGIHFPIRNHTRLEFMKGYGVMLSYVHDIGMLDGSPMGQDMHAEYITQAIYNDFFDQQLTILWEENSGNVAWRITQLAMKKALTQPPKHILREMLALSCAHSKDTITTDLLNHPAELRRRIQEIVGYGLQYRWLQFKVEQAIRRLAGKTPRDGAQFERLNKEKVMAEEALEKAIKEQQVSTELNPSLKLFYENYWQDSFQWLVSSHPEARELMDDVIDTIRTLRCANASRQRGARLRATGDHQIFLDHHSANALYAINANDRLFLLESTDNILAGEVNLASTEFTQAGDLRISFYRGNFRDNSANERAIFNAAIAINEVQEYMINSFARPAAGSNNSSADYAKKWKVVNILLENTDDNPQFAKLVQQQLSIINPALKEAIRIVPSLQNAAELERNHYLGAKDVKWDIKTQQELLEKIAYSGHRIDYMHPEKILTHVKIVKIETGETLMEVDAPASFVYIPLNEGLVGYPTGGYQPFHARPFIPLGNTGVIRSDLRNATVVAERTVEVLIIPRETYLNHWYYTYSEAEFVQALKEKL